MPLLSQEYTTESKKKNFRSFHIIRFECKETIVRRKCKTVVRTNRMSYIFELHRQKEDKTNYYGQTSAPEDTNEWNGNKTQGKEKKKRKKTHTTSNRSISILNNAQHT